MAQTVTNAVYKCKPGSTAGFRVLRAAILAVVILLCTGIAALADPALPDSTPTFPHIYINRSVIEADDFILIAEYDLPYAAPPADPANVNFIFELIDTDGVTKLGVTLPYPYSLFDYGYNLGVIAFYFNATDAPTWGESYIIRVITNPAPFSTITSYDTTVPSLAYSTQLSTDREAQQLELADRILEICDDLTAEYAVEIVSPQDTGLQFTSDGEVYFRSAVPGLQSMAPTLFFIQSVDFDNSSRTWGTDLSDTYKERLAGVDGIVGTGDDNWIMASIGGVANWINVPYLLIIGVVVIIVCVLLIRASIQRFGTPIAGYVASLLVVSCAGMLTMGLTVVAIIAFAMILFGGWFIFMRHA